MEICGVMEEQNKTKMTKNVIFVFGIEFGMVVKLKIFRIRPSFSDETMCQS